VPVALNCCVVPSAIETFAGVTANETRTAGVTLIVVDPLMLPRAALIVLLPVAMLVAKPPTLIVATLFAEEVQATEFVRFCVLPSL